MSDFISRMLEKAWYENNYNKECIHQFNISSCNEEGLAVCSECGVNFNELRSE